MDTLTAASFLAIYAWIWVAYLHIFYEIRKARKEIVAKQDAIMAKLIEIKNR